MSGTRLLCPSCQAPLPDGEAAPATCPECGLYLEPAGPSTFNPRTLANRPGAKPRVPASSTPSVNPLEGSGTIEVAELPTVPGYEILDVLGRGGMGVVYKARQSGLKRLVALKMILAGGHAGPDDLARFRTEAEAIARLQHANIVHIFEVGAHEGRPYFSLEFIDGGSLEGKLDGKPLPAREAAQLLEVLARAMHAAHERGIVHRDLKPANVLLTADGLPKITDFGLAKQLDGDSKLTTSGVIMGTPNYMAPEQALALVHEIGPLADVWALGAVLYEMLTGRPPFSGESPLDTILMVATEEPVPPSRLVPKVPRDLETICLRCLQKEQRRRYASAESLADDVRRFLDGEPIRARPIGRAERAWKWARRRPAVAALSALCMLVAIAGFAGVSWKWLEAVEARHNERLRANEAEKAQQEAEKQTLLADSARKDAERNLYFNRIALGSLEWWSNNVGRTRVLLAECRRDQQQWEWHYLDRLCHADRRTFKHDGNWVAGVAVSPDGKRVATASYDHTAQVWEAATGKVLLTLKGHKQALTCIAISPDGTLLATGSDDHTARIWDARSGKTLQTLSAKHFVKDVKFSPDGQQLATAGTDSRIRIWDVATGNELGELSYLGAIAKLAYSPDGQWLAAAGKGLTVVVWNVQSRTRAFTLAPGDHLTFSTMGPLLAVTNGRTVRIHNLETGKVAGSDGNTSRTFGPVSYSPDGQRLAVGGQDGVVRLCTAGGRELLAFRGHTAMVEAVAFTPDGLAIVSASRDGTAKIWDISATQEARTLRGHGGSVNRLAVSPDRRTIATASTDESVILWDADTGTCLRTLTGHKGKVSCVAFSACGRWLASGGTDKLVKIWNRATGAEAGSIAGLTHEVYDLAFSPDGKQLACTASIGVQIVEVPSGRPLTRCGQHAIWTSCLAYAPDGTRLLSGSGDRIIKIWDPATGKEVGTVNRTMPSLQPGVLKGDGGVVHDLVFSADGKRLASTDSEGSIRIWDWPAGRELRPLKGETGEIRSVAFSPDGTRLASTSSENVKIWDLATGREILTLRGHQAVVLSLAYIDSGRLVSASLDGTVKIWNGAPREK